MTRKDILSVAVKILGIYFLVKVFERLPFLVTIVQGLRSGEEWAFASIAIGQGGYMLFTLAAAVILLKWSNSIAARLTKYYESEPTTMGRWLGRNELLELAFTIVGVVVLANALPRIPQIITDFRFEGGLRDRAYASIAALVAQLGIGLYLTLGAQGLVGLLRKIRAGAITSPDNSEGPKSP